MENQFEKGPERILSKEEVLEKISRFAENSTITRELSDEQGLCILETKVEGTKPGEHSEYRYIRKGKHGKSESSATVIHVVYYEDETPVGGHNCSDYNHETGEWEPIDAE